jgi:hypothetical protein
VVPKSPASCGTYYMMLLLCSLFVSSPPAQEQATRPPLFYSVRAARVLSPKLRFCYLDLYCLVARPSCARHFRILLRFTSFRYFLLYLNCQSSYLRRKGNRCPGAPCRCLFPPTLRARPGSQANAALEGHSHISRIRRLLATPSNLLPTQSPSLPHDHTHALTSAYNR